MNFSSPRADWFTDYDHEPLLHKAAEIVKDPSLGPVLYWSAMSQVHIADGSLYQSTEWRTVPDYQGGACFVSYRPHHPSNRQDGF
jgi:hypothetical protein